MRKNNKNKRKKSYTAKKSSVNKATAPNTTRNQRSATRNVSSLGIKLVQDTVKALKPYELSPAKRMETYLRMLQDDAVYSALESRILMLEKCQVNGRFSFNKASQASIEAKRLLEYAFANMTDDVSIMDITSAAATHIWASFAPFEMVYKRGAGEFENNWVIDKFAFVHPLTIDSVIPVRVSPDGNSIISLRQNLNARQGTNGLVMRSTGYSPSLSFGGIKEIDWRKVVYCGYSANPSMPLGTSALDAAYVAWREKQLLQDLAMIGASRDMSGTPVLRLPEDLLADAEDDPSSAAAATVRSLTNSMANMNNGEQSYVVLPSNPHGENGSGVLEFDIKFLGVEGGGRNFDIDAMIENKRRNIYTVLGARQLITGDNGSSGSYNLLEGNASIGAHYVERDALRIDQMFNQVVKKVLSLNNIDLPQEDIPVWHHGEVQPLSLDEQGKYVSRVQHLLPAVPDVVNKLLQTMGVDYRVEENATPDEIREMVFSFKEDSKAGAANGGTSGTGTQAQGNSDSNNENAA